MPPPPSAMEKQQQLQAKEKRKYPIRADDYELFETVGLGVSATVQRARCLPFDEVVAIKILDFERHNSDLNNISREAQTMILIDHPNVLNAHCSFVNGHDLWVVMPFMSGGSCLHIMKSVYPDGFEEVIIATVLRDVLRGLEYLHNHGHIHRDVKAGNILVDTRGGVKLGDFGVSACLFDSGDRQRMRNTFVGTPCWMAPEVMEPSHGYDFKADIWSFGITALELAHGHAPFSRYPPMKVLLMTLQNAPPGLDYESDRKFSKSFKQMIAMCLVKNPSKRPSATKLLKQPFFKQAKGPEYLARKILEGLPTLGDRYQALKDKEENLLAQKKIPDGKKEELSQNEYKRGISSWNFDIEDLKAQASLIPEHEDSPSKDLEWQNSLLELDTLQESIPEGACSTSSILKDEDVENRCIVQNKPTFLASSDQIACYQRSQSNGSDNEPKHACLNDQNNLQNGVQLHISDAETSFSESRNKEMDEKQPDGVPTLSLHERRASTSSCSSDQLRLSKIESFKQQNPLQDMANCNGAVPHTANDVSTEATPKASKSTAPNSDDLDDKSKPPVVQQRGRFKVTSENLDLDKALPPLGLQKSHSMQVISQACASLPSPNAHTSNLGGSVYNQLHCILQTNILQRDNILNLMKQLSTNEFLANRAADGTSLPIPSILSEKSLLQLDGANEREKELIQEITDLQVKVLSLQSELQKLRATTAEVNS